MTRAAYPGWSVVVGCVAASRIVISVIIRGFDVLETSFLLQERRHADDPLQPLVA